MDYLSKPVGKILVYLIFGAAFFQAFFIFIAGLFFGLSAILIDLGKGNLETALFLLPLIGGGYGLMAAIEATCNLVGDSGLGFKDKTIVLGLLSGIISELVVLYYLTPDLEPFLTSWFPQLVAGAFLVFFKLGAYNKAMHRSLRPPATNS